MCCFLQQHGPPTPSQSRARPQQDRESQDADGVGQRYRRVSGEPVDGDRGAMPGFDPNRMTPSHDTGAWQSRQSQEYGLNFLYPSFTETSDPVPLPQQQSIFPTGDLPNEQCGGGAPGPISSFTPFSTAESFLMSSTSHDPSRQMYTSPLNATYSTPSLLHSQLPFRGSSSSGPAETLTSFPDMEGHWDESVWAAYAHANPLPKWVNVAGSPELYSAPDTETLALITPQSLQDVTQTGITSHNASAVRNLLRSADEKQADQNQQVGDQQQIGNSRIDNTSTSCATIMNTTDGTEPSFTDDLQAFCHFTPDSSDRRSPKRLSTSPISSPAVPEPHLTINARTSVDLESNSNSIPRREENGRDADFGGSSQSIQAKSEKESAI
jgi:hypothetical protein